MRPSVFTGEGGQWHVVRGRLLQAQERHSFIRTSSSEADAPSHEEENKHWSTVSQTVRFGRQFAKRRGSRRGSIVTIAGMGLGGSSFRGSVTTEASSSRRGSITIDSPKSSMRRSSITKHSDEKRGVRHEKRSRWGGVTIEAISSRRGSVNIASPNSPKSSRRRSSITKLRREKRKRLVISPAALSAEESRKALDAPRWKQEWLRRKTYMEQRQGGLQKTRSAPPSLESSAALAGEGW